MATLDFVEIAASDWRLSVNWYVEVLGLSVVLEDEAGRFALLDAGTARIAIKESGPVAGRKGARLVFRVDDLDAERSRLLGLGLAVPDPVDNLAEGYHEVRLSDPDGTPITLFAWSRPRA